jgi:hypothetical protein
MPHHAHSIDRWDDATGSNLYEHLAGVNEWEAVPFHHLHGQAFCIASTARTRKSSCIRSGRASMYVTATRAF